MERSWKEFPLGQPRPQEIRRYKRKERAGLELVIAEQVSGLLSRYGEIVEEEIDVSQGDCSDEPKTYLIVESIFIHLEDDSELVIGQIPETESGFLTERGANMVAKRDEDDMTVLELAVWDPEVQAQRRIHDERGRTVRRPILQELYEALAVLTLNPQMIYHSENDTRLPVEEYPKPFSDPEFESLIAHLDI